MAYSEGPARKGPIRWRGSVRALFLEGVLEPAGAYPQTMISNFEFGCACDLSETESQDPAAAFFLDLSTLYSLLCMSVPYCM
jgi:hypothetical protein